MSDSLRPHGLYSPWNSPGQNTGVGSLSLPGDLSNPRIKPRSHIAGGHLAKDVIGSLNAKESACNRGDAGSIPGSGRSPEGEHGKPLQFSCLENPKERGAWWTTVLGVARSQTWLKRRSKHMHVINSLLLLLLLLSRFSHVRLCVTLETAAHQAPPSPGFSRQEHWSGLPFPFPIHESEKWKWSRSVMSDS